MPAIRVVKGQGGSGRLSRRTRGASHNPGVRRRNLTSSTGGAKRSTGRRTEVEGRGSNGGGERKQQRRRPDDGTRLKIILGVAIVMVILIVIIAASSGGGSRYQSRGRYASRTTTQKQYPPIRRDQSFRDYMKEHGTTEELKKRKARIEAFRRGQRQDGR